MQTVKIPDDVKPLFECIINGKHYQYEAGATVSVPDEVAELIKNINDMKPKHTDPVPDPVLPRVTAADNGKVLKVSGGKWTIGSDNDSLPAVTATDNGKVLKVSEGAWGVGTDATGDTLPAVTGDDDGKVLKVIEGTWAAGTDATVAAEE